MTREIWTSAAGAGKTQQLIHTILDRDPLLEEIWLLLPTRLQSEAFRQRLMETAQQQGKPAIFNIRFFEFYELYNTLLDLAGSPQRVIHQSAGDRILRHIIQQTHLDYYHRIAHRAGFVQLVSTFIKELKQGLVDLFAFQQTVQNDKDRDLARLYTAYQQYLIDHNLSDRDGAGWVALDSLRAKPSLVQSVALLAVDGFDDFNPLQIALLNKLATHIPQTIITLTHEAHREQDACRIFARTLDNIRQGAESDDWRIQPLDRQQIRPSPELDHLEKHLFDLQATAMPAEGGLHLIEAPNPRDEIKAVLRRIKQQLLDGTPPDDIMLVMRNPQAYADGLRQTAAAYNIPIAVRQSEAVMNNPAVRTILQLIDLAGQDFPRRMMMDVLHSPYLHAPDFSPEDIQALERISLNKPIVRGRDNWLRGVSYVPRRPDEFDDEPAYQAADEPEILKANLEAFFARITPPPQATPLRYVQWIETLLGDDPVAHQLDSLDVLEDAPPADMNHFNLYSCIREDTPPEIVARDLQALHSFRTAMQQVITAYSLIEAPQPAPIPWQVFRADLELALSARMIDNAKRQARNGRVLAISVFEARGLPHQSVYILGLSEGVFPQQQQEDALYNDYERQRLRDSQLQLSLTADRLRDRELFYEMCALARQHLILSRPTIDDGGNPWTPSAFWHAVQTLITDIPLTTYKPGAPPPPMEVASQREAAISLSRVFSDATPSSPQHAPYMHWLMTQPIWQHIQQGRAIEQRRESAEMPFDQYGGVLRSAALIGIAQDHIDNNLWSATQFNELGACGFRFFSRRMLQLEAYEEPEEGLDVLQLGTLNHKILEDTYEQFAQQGLEISSDNQAQALTILHQVAKRILQSAPRVYQFQVPAYWEQQKANLLRKLELLIQLDFSEDSPVHKMRLSGERVPFRQEALFGRDGQAPLILASDTLTLRAQGAIDRMDRVGNQIIIMDYKSGSSTPSKTLLQEGRNFQMLLYLLAAEQMLAKERLFVKGGLFWSIQSNKDGGLMFADDEIIEHALTMLHAMVEKVRAGNFANQPRKIEQGKCVKYCEFSQFCRINRATAQKPS